MLYSAFLVWQALIKLNKADKEYQNSQETCFQIIIKMKPGLKIIITAFIFTAVLFGGCSVQQRVAEKEKPLTKPEPVGELKQLQSTAMLIDASKQKMLGNFSNAIVLYAEALNTDPYNTAAAYKLSKLHAQQGYLEDAGRYAEYATWLEPENIYYQLVLADIYFLSGKTEQGILVQRGLAEKNPNNLNLQINLLSSLLYTSKLDEAIGVLEHIESISGFNDELSLEKQRILVEMGETEKAVREAERLVTFFPNEPVYLELLADLYMEIDKPEKAYQTYYRILEVQPENAMARLLLADYYRKAGEEERSFRELKKAFQSEQFTVEGKARILFTYYYLSEEDTTYLAQSFELLDILMELHSDDAEANAIYGDFLYREEKLEEARKYFYRAAQIEPSELRFWQQTLIIDSRLNNYENMLKASEEALEYFFEQPVLYLFNGLAHFQKKNYEEAILSFRQGRGLALDDPEFQAEFLTLLGDANYRAGNYDDSDRSYQEALLLNPDNAVALNNFSYHLSLRRKNLEKALEMSARSLEMDPDNAAFLDTYGWIKYKLGNYTEARKWIEKSIQNAETPSATVLEHYGDVLYKLGEKDTALYYWKKAQEKRNIEDDGTSELLDKKVRDQTLYE